MERRTRYIIGFALLVVGLLISIGAWNAILVYQGDVLGKVYIDNVKPRNRILFPLAFVVFKVPDYLLRYFIVGVFITSVGITIVTPSLLKRLAGFEDN